MCKRPSKLADADRPPTGRRRTGIARLIVGGPEARLALHAALVLGEVPERHVVDVERVHEAIKLLADDHAQKVARARERVIELDFGRQHLLAGVDDVVVVVDLSLPRHDRVLFSLPTDGVHSVHVAQEVISLYEGAPVCWMER